jgi:hypothetical protein
MKINFNINLILCENEIANTVGNAISTLADRLVAGPAVDYTTNIIHDKVNNNNLITDIKISTDGFFKSINQNEFKNILYPTSAETSLIEVLKMLFNNLSDSQFLSLQKNKEFKASLGNLAPLFSIYCNYRKNGTYLSDNKFISILLTGTPGTGKTVFMKMVLYVNKCIEKYTTSPIIKYFITGSFFLTKENEAKSMEGFLKHLESLIDSGQKIILAIDEAELLFREKANAPAVTLLLEFLSRISSTINNKDAMFIMLCSTNTSNNFDNAAFRRFKHIIIFNHVEASQLISNMKFKIKSLFSKNTDINDKIINHKLFNSMLNAFFNTVTTVSFGEIDNIQSNIKMYFDRFKDHVNGEYIIILFLSLIEYIKKESNLKNPGDIHSLNNLMTRFYYIIEDDMKESYNINISFKEIIDVIFNKSSSLISNVDNNKDNIAEELKILVTNYISVLND